MVYGFVPRCNAKACEALGLEREAHYAYHRNHLEKVMLLAVTGYAFDSDVEEGGHGLKLGLFRYEAGKMAKRRQNESERDTEGNLTYTGPVVREEGDIYMLDTTVTGSDKGSADKPKFTLRDAFEYGIFPAIRDLVGPGKKYEGYIPVVQGDNAGPHQDASFGRYCKDYCAENGWHWEPQAPQMP